MWTILTAFVLLTAPSAHSDERTDRYGGVRSIETEATGFFYIKQIEGRWMFVTPEGHGYIPLGVNHLKSYFSGENVKGSEDEPNLVDVIHGGDKDAAVKHVVSLLRGWGFNYAGYDAPWEFQDKMPFSVGFYPVRASAVIRKGFAFEDVFDPAFEQKLDREIANHTRPYRDNRYLVGYYLADLPLWGTRKDLTRDERQRGDSWISFYRKLPVNSVGHQEYLQFLQRRYAGRFNEFKEIYPTEATSFRDGLRVGFSRVDPAKSGSDDEAFQGVIAERLYGVTVGLFAKHDPNHLVLGERFAGYKARFAPVMKVAAKHFPVVAIQKAGPLDREFFAEVHAMTGRPIISVDHVVSFPTPATPLTRGYQVASEAEAAALYGDYLREAFRQPWFVGYNRCQLVDRLRIPGDPPVYKQGLLQLSGQPHEVLIRAVKETNHTLLDSLDACR